MTQRRNWKKNGPPTSQIEPRDGEAIIVEKSRRPRHPRLTQPSSKRMRDKEGLVYINSPGEKRDYIILVDKRRPNNQNTPETIQRIGRSNSVVTADASMGILTPRQKQLLPSEGYRDAYHKRKALEAYTYFLMPEVKRKGTFPNRWEKRSEKSSLADRTMQIRVE